jgi:hypothetical protein
MRIKVTIPEIPSFIVLDITILADSFELWGMLFHASLVIRPSGSSENI